VPKFQVHIKRPTEKQALFIRAKEKRRMIRAGRRSGKTTGVAIFAAEELAKKRRILYATPTTDQLHKFWFEVKNAFGDAVQNGLYHKNETEHVIEKVGTTERIRAKTAWNADTLRGDYCDVLILDEWQMMDEDAWETVGAPMLMDNNGDAIFIYTPPSVRSRSVSKARDPLHAAKMFKKIQSDPRWFTLHFTSHDNPHISEEGLKEITSDMTRLAYRQEILAEDVEDVPGALWKRKMIDDLRLARIPENVSLARVVVAIDPSGSSTTEAGIVAAALGSDGHGYVLRDASLLAPSPKNWAGTAVALYHELKADRICAERNFGGDMVRATVLAIDENVSYKDVEASRGKVARAEPICAHYEQGRVHHVGNFPELEEEMCSYVEGDRSPNRMDALVWALTELLPSQSAYGWLDYFKSGLAEADLKALEKPREIAASVQTKAEAVPESASCPNCSWTGRMQVIPNGWRCPQCGHQQMGATAVNRGPSRTEVLGG
jgi:rubredoxin